MGPLKDGPGPDGEILFAGVAAVEAAFPRGDAVALLADRADRPLRPAACFQVHARGLLVREHLEKLEGADGEFVVHLLNLRHDAPQLADFLGDLGLCAEIHDRGDNLVIREALAGSRADHGRLRFPTLFIIHVTPPRLLSARLWRLARSIRRCGGSPEARLGSLRPPRGSKNQRAHRSRQF
jgi:hypothetical protein